MTASATATQTKTPGYSYRLGIWFQTTKTGKQTAYYWNYGAGRAVRISLAAAELFIATEQADLAGHPLRGI